MFTNRPNVLDGTPSASASAADGYSICSQHETEAETMMLYYDARTEAVTHSGQQETERNLYKQSCGVKMHAGAITTKRPQCV